MSLYIVDILFLVIIMINLGISVLSDSIGLH